MNILLPYIQNETYFVEDCGLGFDMVYYYSTLLCKTNQTLKAQKVLGNFNYPYILINCLVYSNDFKI